MKHFLNTQDWQRAELDALLADAARFKREPLGDALKGRSIALVFFNPSMRTRTSFELGAFQLGGHAIVLQPGKDAWPIEFDLGTVMDGDTEEHIAEVARVLGRYVDLIGVRAFPKFVDWQRDREDIVLKAFAKYSPVPVINMETITHPCQELAHVMAPQEHFGTNDLHGKKYVLTWTHSPASERGSWMELKAQRLINADMIAFCTCRRFSASLIAMQFGESITASLALTLRRNGRQWLKTPLLVNAIFCSSTMKCLNWSRIGFSGSQLPKYGNAPQLLA